MCGHRRSSSRRDHPISPVPPQYDTPPTPIDHMTKSESLLAKTLYYIFEQYDLLKATDKEATSSLNAAPKGKVRHDGITAAAGTMLSHDLRSIAFLQHNHHNDEKSSHDALSLPRSYLHWAISAPAAFLRTMSRRSCSFSGVTP